MKEANPSISRGIVWVQHADTNMALHFLFAVIFVPSVFVHLGDIRMTETFPQSDHKTITLLNTWYNLTLQLSMNLCGICDGPHFIEQQIEAQEFHITRQKTRDLSVQ